MKKYRFAGITCMIMLLMICFSAGVQASTVKNLSAAGEVINIQTSLLVREAPSRSGDVIGSLKNGAVIRITGETDSWYRIQYGSSTGYVSKTYVAAKAQDNGTVVPFNASAYVNVDGTLNVRSGASMSASVIGSLTDGKGVTITGETADWYQIKYGSGNAYVSKSYISFSSPSNSSSSSGSLTGTVKVSTTLLVRKQASASGTVIGYLTNGKKVSITGESNGYYQIVHNSSIAYVSQKYVAAKGSSSQGSSSSSASGSISSVSKTGYADVSSSLLVRSSASSSASVIGRLSRGARIAITGETNNWYQIDYSGKKGYVNKAYVSFSSVSSVSSSGYEKISLSVPLYHQYDSRWASIRIGSETLKSAGCVTACLAMVQEYRTGITCTPAMMVGKLSYTSGGSVYWPSATTQYTGSNYMTVIYQQLAAGNPVIIGAKYTSGAQHYVVVTGYNGSSSSLSASGFTVNDPGTGGTKTLQAFLARTPRFYKLVYYR